MNREKVINDITTLIHYNAAEVDAFAKYLATKITDEIIVPLLKEQLETNSGISRKT